MQNSIKKNNFTTKQLVILSLMSAISVVLMMFIRFPWPAAPFLEYEPADVPILIATLMYGPYVGLIVTVIVSVIQGLTVSSGSQVIGVIMHILATGSYVIFTGVIYKYAKSRKGFFVAIVMGALVSTFIMLLCNIWFTPIFMNAPREMVMKMLVPVILPFNLVKTFVNGIVAGILYGILKKAKIKF